MAPTGVDEGAAAGSGAGEGGGDDAAAADGGLQDKRQAKRRSHRAGRSADRRVWEGRLGDHVQRIDEAHVAALPNSRLALAHDLPLGALL